jgi:hypothetical protein
MSAYGGNWIEDNSLIFYVDAANYKSHLTGSTYWKDLIGDTLSEGYSSVRGNCPFPVYSNDNGGCFKFDTINNSGLTATASLSFPDDAVTLEAWFRIDSANTEGSSPRVFDTWYEMTNNANDVFDAHSIVIDTDGAIRAWTNEGPLTGATNRIYNYDSVTGGYDTIGKWNHYVMTYGNSIGNVYWDGVSIDTTVVVGGVRDTNRISIGNAGPWYSTNLIYDMSIAIVRVYNIALTTDQVIQNYISSKGRFGI